MKKLAIITAVAFTTLTLVISNEKDFFNGDFGLGNVASYKSDFNYDISRPLTVGRANLAQADGNPSNY